MAHPRRRLIGLLTDFGTAGWYVAAVKGVLLTRCPGAHLLDLTQDIPPQDVVAGALTLAATMPWLPAGTVVIAVVDPGVGTRRRILAAAADGRYLVGPDNGLLSLALDQARTVRVVEVTNRTLWLPVVSRTFHGRDIMAPVGARLANGEPLSHFGPLARRYRRLDLPAPEMRRGKVRGAILYIDTFGNLITNLPGSLFAHHRNCIIRYQRIRAHMVSSYKDASEEGLIALVGSHGYLELAVPQGSAAARCRARRGDRVEVQWVNPGSGRAS